MGGWVGSAARSSLSAISTVSFFTMKEFKGGYLDFSHLIELKTIYITDIHMKKQHKSSITKNHEIKKKKKCIFLMVFP